MKMDINITRLRLMHNVFLLEKYDRSIRDFVEDGIDFYVFYSQSYQRIIEKLKPIVMAKDLDSLKPNVIIALDELAKNPVFDTNYNEPFMFYKSLIQHFEDILTDECLHELSGDGGFASCKKSCGKYDFGWHCKDSPDKQCHYYAFDYDDKTGILLANGQVHELKPRKCESSDSCYFCCEPSEKK
jgi:hypothetical protein